MAFSPCCMHPALFFDWPPMVVVGLIDVASGQMTIRLVVVLVYLLLLDHISGCAPGWFERIGLFARLWWGHVITLECRSHGLFKTITRLSGLAK